MFRGRTKFRKLRLEFKKEDFWIGAFWHVEPLPCWSDDRCFDLWLCLIPCFPLHYTRRYELKKLPEPPRINSLNARYDKTGAIVRDEK